MKIRSITYFLDPGWPLDGARLRAAGEFLAAARLAYETGGYEVQTVRLATVPFPHLLKGSFKDGPRLAAELSRLMPEIGAGYISLGPALPESPEGYGVIPEMIVASENVFFGGVMADATRGVDLAAVRACAETIVRVAPLDPNGFANLRFAALANVPGGAPFFPAAYHGGGGPAFALATESADLAVEAFQSTRTLEDGRSALVAEITKHGQALARISAALSSQAAADGAPRFLGIDFSLAPFPADVSSLGGAVEAMGVPGVGLHGSLAAAAILTEAIERADFPRTGFSGFMQPVLEDSVLARRAQDGTLTVKDLLLYSAVCGTGLDTVPLPGETTSGQIAALLLDIATLALRLNKPLTARLMPVPGKQAGDPTGFSFDFFSNSRVMSLEAQPLGRALGGSGVFSLRSKAQ
jgi:uncharacterized protein (UPF0210 family)